GCWRGRRGAGAGPPGRPAGAAPGAGVGAGHPSPGGTAGQHVARAAPARRPGAGRRADRRGPDHRTGQRMLWVSGRNCPARRPLGHGRGPGRPGLTGPAAAGPGGPAPAPQTPYYRIFFGLGDREHTGGRPGFRSAGAGRRLEVFSLMTGVPTSAGEVSAADLGVVLMHEHVFIRTEALQQGWPGFGGWDEEAEVAAARVRLTALKQAGVDTILDMTVPGLGRDVGLVARTAQGTGLRIMFATG